MIIVRLEICTLHIWKDFYDHFLATLHHLLFFLSYIPSDTQYPISFSFQPSTVYQLHASIEAPCHPLALSRHPDLQRNIVILSPHISSCWFTVR
jgi:hypothetical protein